MMRVTLGLDYAKQKEIEKVGDYGKQKMECVEQWRLKAGDKSTYRAFIEAARKAGQNDVADKVVAMLQEREIPAEGRLVIQACPWTYIVHVYAEAIKQVAICTHCLSSRPSNDSHIFRGLGVRLSYTLYV